MEEAVNNWIHSTNQLKQKQKIKLLFLFSSIGLLNQLAELKIYYNSTGLMQMVTHLLSKSGIIWWNQLWNLQKEMRGMQH